MSEPQALTELHQDVTVMKEELQMISITVREIQYKA